MLPMSRGHQRTCSSSLEAVGPRAGPGRLSSGLRGLALLAPSDLRRGGQGREDPEDPEDRGSPEGGGDAPGRVQISLSSALRNS